jgi:hypothetical protein
MSAESLSFLWCLRICEILLDGVVNPALRTAPLQPIQESAR